MVTATLKIVPMTVIADADRDGARDYAASEDGAVGLQRRVLGPDDQPAVFDDVWLAGQAGRHDADERVQHGHDDDEEDADLDRFLEQRFVFEPRRAFAGRRGACAGARVDHEYTPSWPIRWASLFAADDQDRAEDALDQARGSGDTPLPADDALEVDVRVQHFTCRGANRVALQQDLLEAD